MFCVVSFCWQYVNCLLNARSILSKTHGISMISLLIGRRRNLCLLSFQYLHGLKLRSNWPFSLKIGGALSENQIHLAPNVFYNTAQSFLPGLARFFRHDFARSKKCCFLDSTNNCLRSTQKRNHESLGFNVILKNICCDFKRFQIKNESSDLILSLIS